MEQRTPTETILRTEPECPSRVTRKMELLRSLSPERRALFEEMVALREKIGPVNIDVGTILRELREDG
jgi:hypothetical protein